MSRRFTRWIEATRRAWSDVGGPGTPEGWLAVGEDDLPGADTHASGEVVA